VEAFIPRPATSMSIQRNYEPCMSPDRVLQPLVACLGNPVAGNPTQFVMSRIARDAELDWRFFTSEVDPDQFETAFRGIQALGMAGVAILAPFQERVLPLLDTATEAALAMGGASIARCEGASWIGDHTLGQAIVQLLQSRFASIGPGEDPVLAPQSIAVWGSGAIAKSVQYSLPALDGDFTLFACGDVRPEASSSDPVHPGPLVDFKTFDDMLQLERPIRALIVEDASAMMRSRRSRMAKVLPKLAWASRPLCVLLHGRSIGDHLEIGEWLAGREVDVADEVELMAHHAAVDFHFWTGQEPNLELIRESLEEYLQW